jgi:hypothetical protein
MPRHGTQPQTKRRHRLEHPPSFRLITYSITSCVEFHFCRLRWHLSVLLLFQRSLKIELRWFKEGRESHCQKEYSHTNRRWFTLLEYSVADDITSEWLTRFKSSDSNDLEGNFSIIITTTSTPSTSRRASSGEGSSLNTPQQRLYSRE